MFFVPYVILLVVSIQGSAALPCLRASKNLLIVGLGNMGETADGGSRHNIGYDCIDHFAALHRAQWKDSLKFITTYAAVVVDSEYNVGLAKPLTYMNEAGESVARL